MNTPQPAQDLRGTVERLIREMAGATQSRGMYGGAHKLAREAVAKLLATLSEIFGTREDITVGIIGDEIAFEKEPFYELSKIIGGFIANLKESGIEKITILKVPSDEEVAAFLDIIGMSQKALAKGGGLEKVLEGSVITHIVVGRLSAGKEGLSGVAAGDLTSVAKGVFRDGETYLEKTFEDIRQSRTIDISAARFFVLKLISNLARNKNSLLMLTSIKSHDEYTFVHSINVAIFTVIQAEALGLGEHALTDLGMAGLLHDMGKLVLSGDILRKPTGLDERDIREIHRHPIEGAKLLLQTVSSNPLAAIAAFEHHLRYDQKGYPPRAFDGPVNPASMMVTIADVYDALRSKRAYHEDMAPERTYEEMMKMAGTHFDPRLLANFFQIVGVFPPGTVVELDDKSIGIVLRQSATDIRRPQVEVLYDSDGRKIDSPRIANLLERDKGAGQYRLTIVKSIAAGKYEVPDKFKA